MKLYPLFVSSLFFLLILLAVPQTDGNRKILEVRQSDNVDALAGESVNITCSFVTESRSYNAKWTLGCDSEESLHELPCYKSRINITLGPDNKTSDSGACCEKSSVMTIVNVAESDSGIYCCHAKTFNKEDGKGSGTRLTVTPRPHPSGPHSSEKNGAPSSTMTVALYATIVAMACVILILLILVIRYYRKGSSHIQQHQVMEHPEPETGLHYAEIFQKNQPKRPGRSRDKEEKVTYAPVRTHH